MGFFGRLTRLTKGMWKVKTKPDPEFSVALEKELEHVVSAQEKARAKARLAKLKGGEAEIIEASENQAEGDSETDAEKPSLKNPPKKTL